MLSCVNEKTCKVLINEFITLIEEATYRISKDDNSEKFIMKSPEILHYIEGKMYNKLYSQSISSFFIQTQIQKIY